MHENASILEFNFKLSSNKYTFTAFPPKGDILSHSAKAQARTAWGIQGGRRRPQAAHPRCGGHPPAGRRRVGH
jgi:hypothetical protein